MSKIKAKQQKPKQTLAIFHEEKEKYIYPKSNKEYIDMYVSLYAEHKKEKQHLKLEARTNLAKRYIAYDQLEAASNQFKKMKKQGFYTEGTYGMAHVHYSQKRYDKALSHLQQIATHNAASYLLLAKCYFAQQLLENVFEPLHKAYELEPANKETLIFRAKFFEHYYRTVLDDMNYCYVAIESYHQLFAHYLLNPEKKHIEASGWHCTFTNFIILLLQTNHPRAAVDLLEQYFKLLPMHSSKDIKTLFSTKRLYTMTPVLRTEKNEWLPMYNKMVPLLQELLAYSYLLVGAYEDSLRVANKMQHKRLKQSIGQLKFVEQGAIQFHYSAYMDKIAKIERKFLAL